MTAVPGYHSEARGTIRENNGMREQRTREATPRQAMPPTNGDRLHRRRRSTNIHEFPLSIIPKGMTYEWKRLAVYGKPDSSHQINLRENHWSPVPASRHPEYAEDGETVITRGGADILMERPEYLTAEAQMEDINEALRPIQVTEEKLYGIPENQNPNQFSRNHPSVRKVAGITQEWAPGAPITDGSLVSDP